jgi:hypothetical protein
MRKTLLGHEMLNHLGETICVTAQTLRRLDSRHYLKRDRASGLLKMIPRLYPLWLELEPPDIELGRDMSGPNSCICGCDECKAVLSGSDHRTVSRVYQRQVVEDALAAVRARRVA